MRYFDLNTKLVWEDMAVRDSTHQFAKEVIRPAARSLDRMTAEETVAPGSPLYDVLQKAYELGYHKAFFPESLGGPGFTPLQKAIFYEELSWGSAGLATTLGVAGLPFLMLASTGNRELINRFVLPFLDCRDGSIRGCWAGTEPNHGTDTLNTADPLLSSPGVKGDVLATQDGDGWLINGQKSAWVSSGTISTHCLLLMQVDRSKGLAGSAAAFVPMDLPGVSKGAPLEKLGQRDLNQGEIFFDNVRIPNELVLIGPDAYQIGLAAILGVANCMMSINCTGIARAAFEETLVYAKERVQGGKLLIEHDSIKQRLFSMFARVETCRSLSRAVAAFNLDAPYPFTEYSIAAKITATELSFQNTNEAIQMFGGYGLTKEYEVEKLFRDARATLIEDGTNEFLAQKGGQYVIETYPRINSLPEGN